MKKIFREDGKYKFLLLAIIIFSFSYLVQYYFYFQSVSNNFASLTPPATQGAIYYVNNASGSNCSDSGQGTQAQPWCTIQKAALYSNLNPGDTVSIANGIYREQITFTRSGTTGNPITFKAIGSSVIITSAYPINESLFIKTSGYSNVYEITEANLPTQVRPYDPIREGVGVAQLDGATLYVPPVINYQDFDKSVYQNPFQQVSNIADVNSIKASWYFDVSSRKLYVHTRNDDSPAVNNHELEIFAAFSNRALNIAAGVHDITFDSVQNMGLKLRYAGLYQLSGNNSNITLKNFESIGSGINISGNPINTKIQDCYIHDGLLGSGGTTGDGLYIGGSTGTKISNCVVEKFWNNAQWGSNNGTVVDRLVSRDCPNHGFGGSDSNNMTIENSIFLRCQDSLYLRGNGSGDRNMTILNNLFGGIILQDGPGTSTTTIPHNIYMRNNIFTNYSISITDGPSFTFNNVGINSDYNFFLPADGGDWLAQTGHFEISGGSQQTLSEWWQLMPGVDSHSSTCNPNSAAVNCTGTAQPIWVNYLTDDFHLVSGARPINTGTTIANDHDYDNNFRPQGIGYDIGPYELVAGMPDPANLNISPPSNFGSAGFIGGPFSPSSFSITISNTGAEDMNWSAEPSQSWFSLSSSSGILSASSSQTITAALNSGANNLSNGIYTNRIAFTNLTNGQGDTTRTVTLNIIKKKPARFLQPIQEFFNGLFNL